MLSTEAKRFLDSGRRIEEWRCGDGRRATGAEVCAGKDVYLLVRWEFSGDATQEVTDELRKKYDSNQSCMWIGHPNQPFDERLNAAVRWLCGNRRYTTTAGG